MSEFVEMMPSRERNWCCGDGGGVVAVPEFSDTRGIGDSVKVRQIRETGAEVVATTCDNCKLQIFDLSEHYSLGVRMEGVMDAIARALVP